jgi:hypothetical protein
MTDHASSRRRLSRRKRLLFGLMALVLSIPIVELISWLAINVLTVDGLQRLHTLQELLALGGSAKGSLNEVVHPYLGWVTNPQISPPTTIGAHQIPVNGFGFNDVEHHIPKRSADRLVVGVVGGSVAWQMTVLGESAFRDALGENPAWREREIQIVRLAMSGYKQPQQLMTLNFLLALGAEFDVIVNIDGYNEIALAACENDKSRVFTAYPRMWHLRAQDIVDPRVYDKSFRLLQVRATRQELAHGICNSWFRWSPTFNLVWKIRDMYWENQLVDLASRLSTGERAFATGGPRQEYTTESEMFDHLRDIWKNCSLQIHHLCQGNGTKYIHVLQPNQYLAGSKPMTDLEWKKMYVADQDYGKVIAQSYPLLIAEGPQLQKLGIDFHDLTMIFAATEETIYADPFCHYNARGNEILARAVAAAVIDAFATDDR